MKDQQRGVVLLTMMVFILMSCLGASSLVVSYQTQLQREKEQELLFVGSQFRKAITSYYNTIPPGGARALPLSLEALVSDNRFPTPVQHLRKVYLDPITGKADWVLIRANGESGGILGVRSSSTRPTVKRHGFAKGDEHLEGKESYADWAFALPVH